MTNDKLSQAYLVKAKARLKALQTLHDEKDYSDVVREAQECVELLLKAVLRQVGLEVPKTHDVSHVLSAHKANLPQPLQSELDEVISISRTLRKERELAFYGTEDWIPTEEYSKADSDEAMKKAKRIYDLVSQSLLSSSPA